MHFKHNDNIEFLSNTIPKNAKYLYFGHNFNQSVDMLPTSIKELSFGYNFNQSVDMLSTSIKYLDFVDKCLLKILHVSNTIHNIYKNHKYNYEYNYSYALTKNENTPFSKHKITFDMIHKNGNKLLYNIKKIPYGGVCDNIVYIYIKIE